MELRSAEQEIMRMNRLAGSFGIDGQRRYWRVVLFFWSVIAIMVSIVAALLWAGDRVILASILTVSTVFPICAAIVAAREFFCDR